MDREKGIDVDPLAVALTRPSTILGVPYEACMINILVSVEALSLTENLLWLPARSANVMQPGTRPPLVAEDKARCCSSASAINRQLYFARTMCVARSVGTCSTVR